MPRLPWPIGMTLCECISRPTDVLLRAVKERRKDREQCNSPAVNDWPMYRVPRNEHQIALLDSSDLLADSEPAPTFEYEHKFVVIRLDVDDIRPVFQNVDVAGNVLTVAQEGSLDGVRCCRRVGFKTANGFSQSKEVLRLQGVLLSRWCCPSIAVPENSTGPREYSARSASMAVLKTDLPFARDRRSLASNVRHDRRA